MMATMLLLPLPDEEAASGLEPVPPVLEVVASAVSGVAGGVVRATSLASSSAGLPASTVNGRG